MRTLTLLLAILIATPAAAAGRDEAAELLALEANRVRDELCADGVLSDTTAAAKSLSQVTDVWARVSEELDRSRKAYLLYWRGVLAQCLSQEGRAIDDLQLFVEKASGRTAWESLVDDARRRLDRLVPKERVVVKAAPPNAGALLGVVLAGSAGAAGGLAGWQWAEAMTIQTELYGSPHRGDDLEARGIQGDQHQTAQRLLVGTSVGLGVGSLASFIIGGTTAAKDGRQAALLPTVAVVPTADGATIVLAGRW